MVTTLTDAISAGFKVPGHSSTQDSYRNEIAGLYAIIAMIRCCVKTFHLDTAALAIGCDGEGALKRSFATERPATLQDNHWDILTALQQDLRAMPQLRVEWIHVKGHQDDILTTELDEWAQMNIRMDAQATIIREHRSQPPCIPALETRWRPMLDRRETRVRNVICSIRDHCTADDADTYWTNKGTLGTSTPDQVDWHATGLAMAETPPKPPVYHEAHDRLVPSQPEPSEMETGRYRLLLSLLQFARDSNPRHHLS